MRISTSTIYDTNVAMLNQMQAKLLHTQQQVVTGRRILTPADDPANSARALEVIQSDATNTQYSVNRNEASHSLSLSETIMSSVTSLLHDVRTSTIQAGDAILNTSDKRSIAVELRGRLDDLLALANGTDGVGNYLFSGFQGRTLPFTNSATGVQYMADDGQRLIQVSSSRQIAATDSGADIFMRIKNGNGTFTPQATATNAGTGIISQGVVADPALITGHNYQVTFTVTAGVPTVTTYEVTDITNGGAVVNDPATGLPLSGVPYVSGQAINFDGMQFDITGEPANGDTFTLSPSVNESIFQTISNLITALESSTSPTQYTNSLNTALNNLDRDLENILTVRSSLGARLRELDALQNTGEDLGLQFKHTLSNLQDVDYNKAITDLTQQQINLQAAQKSFQRISEMSMFNYI